MLPRVTVKLRLGGHTAQTVSPVLLVVSVIILFGYTQMECKMVHTTGESLTKKWLATFMDLNCMKISALTLTVHLMIGLCTQESTFREAMAIAQCHLPLSEKIFLTSMIKS